MAEQLARELQVFYELARVAAADRGGVDHVLDRTCAEIRTAFGFDRALLVRYDNDADTVHAVVQQNIEWPGDEWLPLSMFPLLQRALERGTAYLARDPKSEGLLPESVVARFGVGAIVVVPLVIEQRVLGFLVADHAGRDFELDERDLQLLTALSFVAAVFIDKADQLARLERALADARRLERAQSDFISIASHELRTPIAVLAGVASTLHLRGNELTTDQLVQLRATLYTQSQRLRDLVEQLLDLSRIDGNAVSVKAEAFRPREACDALLPQLAPDRLRDFEIAIDPALVIRTDPRWFERIVANLVTNAVRYGAPPITLRCERDREFRLVVEDRGDGVDPEFVPRLYERFSRSEETLGGDIRGAGLGLAIARSYAAALGGDLRYAPADPRGARFTLALPGSVLAAAA